MNKFIRALLILLIPVSLSGQTSPVSYHYLLNPLYINPAFAGSRGDLNIAASYRRQWVGISGAPETAALTVDAPFIDSKLGLGLIVVMDKTGVTKQTRFGSIYAYRIRMGEGTLSLGLGAGIITTNTAWSDLTVPDPGDENYLVSSRIFVVPDFKFGVYYITGNYFAGISIPELVGYSFDYEKNRYTMKVDPGKYNYLFNAGYIFNLSPGFKFSPSTLLSYSPGRQFLYDINASFIIIDRIWAGASYRNNRSIGALLQLAINTQFRVAYSYDYDIGKLGRFSNGTHEIMLRYEFNFKVNAVNPLIF